MYTDLFVLTICLHNVYICIYLSIHSPMNTMYIPV